MHAILWRVLSKSKKYVRYKHKDTHWSVQIKKIHPVDKALQHFDDFYAQVFGTEWEAIRNGLLNNGKYVAVVNNYADVEDTISKLENRGALNMRTLFNLEKGYIKEKNLERRKEIHLNKIKEMDVELEKKYQQSLAEENNINIDENKKFDFSLETSLKNAELDVSRVVDQRNILSASILQEFVPASQLKGKEDWIPESKHYSYYEDVKLSIEIEKEYDLHFPENLNVYSFEKSNYSEYRPPRKGQTGVLNYYLMDGGSVLPVLALGLKPGDTFLDMCASPGGKTMLALQTLYPDVVVANDLSKSRVRKLVSVLKEYFYDLNERFLDPGKIKITNKNGCDFEEGEFDCILVDVPCTNDRFSLKENDNNIFRPSRIKERLQLPVQQSEILVNALKLVKIGGTVVYSTCTLSPIQNDGVVQMALKQINERTDLKFVIKDLTEALQQTKVLYKYSDKKILKFGHLIIPYIPLNFGPTYFCKLKRIK